MEKKMLERKDQVNVIKYTKDNMAPMTQEDFIFRQEGEGDDPGKYPDLKDETERNRVHRPPLSGPSHIENSDREMQGKERNPNIPRREHMAKYKTLEGVKRWIRTGYGAGYDGG